MARRQVSPAEVAEAHLARIERLDPRLNAFAAVRHEVLADAERLARRADLGSLPLAGVPVAVKDNVDVEGVPTRHGSRATSAAPAERDDELVVRLRAAGALVIGKTQMCELAAWAFTSGAAFGATRNPWDPGRDPGGSTGGGAVAVAAGMAALALGSDGGGSIRIPASHCGVVGLKPGDGVVPVAGGIAHHWCGLTAFGPIASTVADAALALDILAGRTVHRGPAAPAAGLRVALSRRGPAGRADRARQAALGEIAELLRGAGHAVEEADPPYPPALPLRWMRRWLAGIAADAEGLASDRLEPRTRAMVRRGRLARRLHRLPPGPEPGWAARASAWFERCDLMISPTVARPAAAAGALVGRAYVPTLLDGVRSVVYTQAWNLAGFPAASVPAGLDGDGMPVGVQLVGPPGSERLLLRVGAQLERLRPWGRPPLGDP